MKDDIIDTIRYSGIRHFESQKQMMNHLYGRKHNYSIKIDKSSRNLKGTSPVWTFVNESIYEDPWDAKIWRKWQGRAEEFWDARMQPKIKWEFEKNGGREV